MGIGQPERGWQSIDLLRAVALFFGVYLLLQFLWVIRSILIIAILGVLFGLALSGGVDWVLQWWKVKRGVAASLIMLLVLGVLVGIGALVAPMIRDQMVELQRRLPEAIQIVERWLGSRSTPAALKQPQSEPAAQPASPAQQARPAKNPDADSAPATRSAREGARQQQASQRPPLRDQLSRQMGGLMQYLFPFVSGTAAAATGVILILFIALYVASEPGLYRRGLLHLFPHRMRGRANEVLCEIGISLRRWLVARLLAMILIGAITTGAMLLIGVESALVLGLIAGLLEFIPLFGPIISAVPAIGLALADSPQKAIWVVVAFIVIQQMEGNIVTPLLLKNRVDIPPALTVVMVAVMGVIFGFIGLLVAEPILAATMVAVKMLWVEDVVGDQV